MKTATFSKRFNSLEFFNTRNTSIHVHCTSVKIARAIIKNSGIEQELIINGN